MVAAFDSLSETERECLRLVHRGLASKDIADIRGIRPDSVDKIILSARRKLGNRRRQELARLLVEHETEAESSIGARYTAAYRRTDHLGEDHPQSSGTQPLGLAAPSSDSAQEVVATTSTTRTAGTGTPTPEPEDQAPARPRPFLATPMPFAPDGSQENNLGALHTIAVIAILVTAVIAAAGAAVSLLFALNQLTSQ